MKWTLCLIFFLAILTEAAELKPILKNGFLGVYIIGMDLPPNFEKDLKSGLTNKFLILTTGQCDTLIKLESNSEIGIKYDLWKENFTATVSQNQSSKKIINFSLVSEVYDFLTKMKMENLFSSKEISSCKLFTLTSEILFDPISKEKIEKIKKWFHENSSPNPGVIAVTGNRSRSQPIFNKIFEQYANGENLGSYWKVKLSTQPFNILEIQNEKQ